MSFAFIDGGWSSEAPIPADAWKRAVYRRPPKNFHVQLLPPQKHGSSCSYGFRIHPMKDDDASIITRTTSSGGSITCVDEYDVWRKWEDCLFLQDTLEVEYARAAREKRKRLAAGKGVKKNGVYVHSDQAASWESLPFGPDPNDIAHDIHEYIPKLAKKGTFFRASQETVDHRYEELRKMMHALLQDDLPTIIKDIKGTLSFTDFFGLWRRDIDLARKVASARKPPADRSRTTPPISTLSAFPVSLSSFPARSPDKGKTPERAQLPFRLNSRSDSSCSEDSVDPPRPGRLADRKQEIRATRSRGSSSESVASSSSPSTPVTMSQQLSSSPRQPVVASQETSIRFDHNPHILNGDRRSSFLESLPEGRELPSSQKSEVDEVRSRRRSGSTASSANRNARVYVASPSNSPQSSESLSRSLSRRSRASLKSTLSLTAMRASAYLDELDVDYCLPSPTPESRWRPRASVSSMASIMSNSSVDAVIPRGERPPRPSRPPANNTWRPSSYPEEPWSQHEPWSEDESEDQGDILDAYFSDLIKPRAPTPEGFPETPAPDETMYRLSQAQYSSRTTITSFSRFSDRRSSLTTMTSTSSGSTTSSGDSTTLSIKAVHEDNIVMLHLPRYITFDELRQKIYDKFMQTDKSAICQSFAVALLDQPPAGRAPAGVRPRPGSTGSTYTKGAALYFISSQDEWDDVVAIYGGKLVLRIIGSRE